MKIRKEGDNLAKTASLIKIMVYTGICLRAKGEGGFFENMHLRTKNNLQILSYPYITKIPANIFDIHIAVKCNPSSSIKARIDKKQLRTTLTVRNKTLLNESLPGG